MTAIEWTQQTWNPVTGCDRISPGCDHCYALALAGRLKRMGQPKYQHDGNPRTSGPGFAVTTHPQTLTEPFSWPSGRLVFVNSMSDLFHPRVPSAFVAQVLAVVAATPRHTYQVLTKRPRRARDLLGDDGARGFWNQAWAALGELVGDQQRQAVDAEVHARLDGLGAAGWWLPNLWLGASVELDRYAWRAQALRQTPAAARFLSLEPLLGPLPSLDLAGIGWVILGGESGPRARPLDLGWVRELRDRAHHAGAAVFVKQLGTCWARAHGGHPKGGDPARWPADLRVRELPATREALA
jgi:protein gp37